MSSVVNHGSVERFVDDVAVEEPLEVRIAYYFKEARIAESFAVTMRTPGHDRELAAGLLFSEGVLRGLDDLVDLRMLGSTAEFDFERDSRRVVSCRPKRTCPRSPAAAM